MWLTLKRLSLGIFLILLTSSALLVSDWNRRKSKSKRVLNVAVLQHASQSLLDDAVKGMIDGLSEKGYTDGKTISLKKFNAENDLATDNTIAKELTDGQYDLVLTASTLSTQAVANANKTGKTIHVFGAVADPFISGLGISRENPLDHPKHLVGIGTFMPVAASLDRKSVV